MKFDSGRQASSTDGVTGTALIRWVMAVGLLLVVGIVAAATWAVDDHRERALRNGERELANAALLLARHFDREFEELIADESEIVSHVERHDPQSTPEMHQLLRSKTGGTGDIDLFDSTGVLVASSRSRPAPYRDISGNADFKQLKARPVGAERYLQFVEDSSGGDRVLLLQRGLSGANGEFAGVFARTVPLKWYERFFASVALGETAAVSMFHTDGTFLTRYPEGTMTRGENFRTSLLEPHFAAPAAIVRLTSPFDGEERLGASHRLTQAPIIVIASRAVDSVLADWRQQTVALASAALAAIAVIATLTFLLGRHLRRREDDTRRQLRLEKQRLRLAINNMTQGLTLFDAEDRLVVCNQRYLEIYGLTAEMVPPGITFREMMQCFRDRGGDRDDIERFLCSGDGFSRGSHEATIGDKSLLITREPVEGGGWVTTHEDVTERKRVEARIAYLAHNDELTDLPNRSSFRQYVQSALANLGDGFNAALLYLDIDDFKGVNDTLGHVVGDLLLHHIASDLKRAVGKDGFVARLGGDEFAVVVTNIEAMDEITALTERVQSALYEFHDCGEHRLSADASIGIAIAPQDGKTLDELVSNADLALYAAKSEGRRTYRFFKPEMEVALKARHLLGADLKRAVVEHQFDVHFQPLVDLRSDQVVGCEALLRWRHPTRGMVSPAEFVPVAEEIGLIDELGEWVLAESCREAANWPAHMTVAVNVSPIQFRRRTFPLKVVAALGQSGLSAQRLELEITEAVLIRDDDAALAILNELRALGVKIALDDFGTGYSSLSYLHRFPFDKIKIDRSFVATLAEEKASATIVQAVVSIAAAGDKITLAEGVETVQQRELLKRLGCQQMQGYLFSRPLPSAQLHELLGLDRKELASSRRAS